MSLALRMATVYHHSLDKSDRKVDTAVQVNSVTDMTSSSTLSCVFFDLGVDTTLVPLDVTPVVDALAPPVAPTPAVIYHLCNNNYKFGRGADLLFSK